ncbi:hypothetical protein C8Q80DRAFT_605115 [Daedaleopsis nitida]|nr:hypothetical protein C8Q80DRAFT_605115 [Daedaleopsis nitida]
MLYVRTHCQRVFQRRCGAHGTSRANLWPGSCTRLRLRLRRSLLRDCSTRTGPGDQRPAMGYAHAHAHAPRARSTARRPPPFRTPPRLSRVGQPRVRVSASTSASAANLTCTLYTLDGRSSFSSAPLAPVSAASSLYQYKALHTVIAPSQARPLLAPGTWHPIPTYEPATSSPRVRVRSSMRFGSFNGTFASFLLLPPSGAVKSSDARIRSGPRRSRTAVKPPLPPPSSWQSGSPPPPGCCWSTDVHVGGLRRAWLRRPGMEWRWR